jgi:hypothetical protein
MACTVCSMVPFAIREPYKPGLHPGTFPMAPSVNNEPVLTIIKGCTRAQYDENFKQIPMPVPDDVVAGSVVDDYILSQSYTSPDERPALFWVSGEWSVADFKKNFAKEMATALEKQTAWFRKLVKVADDEWQRFHQHKMISDLQRTAAGMLNYKREWLEDTADMITKCQACQSLISTQAAVCPACKCILNAEKYAKFQFAGTAPVTVQPVKA